jgi:hypothetical protein
MELNSMTETRTESELTAETETEAPNFESAKQQPEKFMGVIPWQLQDESFRFTGILPEGEKSRGEASDGKRSDGKRPAHKWKKDPQQYNSPKMVRHLKKHPAYAVIGGHGNLVVLDVDSEEGRGIVEELPETFTTLSANKKLPHVYIKVDAGAKPSDLNRYLPMTEEEESQWVKNFDGSSGKAAFTQKPLIEVKGYNSIVTGCNSRIGVGKEYEPINDVAIAEISLDELETALSKFGVSKEEQGDRLATRIEAYNPNAFMAYQINTYSSQSKESASYEESGKFYDHPTWKDIVESVTMKAAYEEKGGVFKSEHRQKCLFCGSVRGVDISGGKYICYSEGCKVWHTSPWFFFQAVEKQRSEKGEYDWKKCSLDFARLAGKKYYKQWQEFLKSHKVKKNQKAIQQGKTETEKRLHEFNKNNFVAEINGVAKFCLETTNEFGEPVVRYRDKKDFVVLNSRLEKVLVDKYQVPFTKVWMEWPERRQYDGVIFRPVGIGKTYQNDRFYNMWRGFSVKPEAGDCSRILHHLKEVTCDGNTEHFNYLMLWLAHMIQMPETKPAVAVVVKGEKGTGKSIVTQHILQRILGEHYGQYCKGESVTGKFNSHLKNKLLIVLEEAIWAGDKDAEGTLKSMITDRDGDFEQKGMDKEYCRTYSRFYFNTNERRSVPATLDERRYFILRSSSKYVNNRKYFDALIFEIENGGVEAFLEVLKNYTVDEGDVRNPPVTKALLEDVEAGMNPFERWLFDLVSEPENLFVNRLSGEKRKIVWGERVTTALLFDHYIQWIEDATAARAYVAYSDSVSRKDFTTKFKEVFKLTKTTKIGPENALRLPSQLSARRLFLGKFEHFAEFEQAVATPEEVASGDAMTDEELFKDLELFGGSSSDGQAA